MSFRDVMLGQSRPTSIRKVKLPRRENFFPSPADWRDEIIYFLLPDRFSDGNEARRPMLDRANLAAARPSHFTFEKWAQSGGNDRPGSSSPTERFQGGTIAGIRSKLDYLGGLGVTTLWIGPIFKQRAHADTFHGYAIQNFLDVDPRFGNPRDLVDLVDSAHAQGLRVILDIVLNHSGTNWIYADGEPPLLPPYKPLPDSYQKGDWFDGNGNLVSAIAPGEIETGVWPSELQSDDYYTRAGGVDWSGDLDDDYAPFRRTDLLDGRRDFNFDNNEVLSNLARCYKYWIALTDCDGFRIDTFKHVPYETGRNFCGTIKEFAANLGKADFFLVGEVASSDEDTAKYRKIIGQNLNATLDIGGSRRILHSIAKGLSAPDVYFNLKSVWDDDFGSHRNAGAHHVSILDDHDHFSGEKLRFSTGGGKEWQVVAGTALQLFTLGIPAIYYGTEQGFAGPEREAVQGSLPDFNPNTETDRYLREAMFGPEHPRLAGRAGLVAGEAGLDKDLPGFGPFGTSGQHCFNPNSAPYVRIAHLIAVRRRFPVLRYGRQYQRLIVTMEQMAGHSNSKPFTLPAAGQLIAWSRILDDEEALCIVNGHGGARRSGDVQVAPSLNDVPAGAEFEVVANTEQAATPAFAGAHPVGQRLPVKLRDGAAFVEIYDLGPSEVVILVNCP
jgi:glycosidase